MWSIFLIFVVNHHKHLSMEVKASRISCLASSPKDQKTNIMQNPLEKPRKPIPQSYVPQNITSVLYICSITLRLIPSLTNPMFISFPSNNVADQTPIPPFTMSQIVYPAQIQFLRKTLDPMMPFFRIPVSACNALPRFPSRLVFRRQLNYQTNA